jgi:hypothetical protein
VCTLERSKVDLANAQPTFQSKRHRDDPPGFIRWETQALGPLEVALVVEIVAARHHPKYVSSPNVARGPRAARAGEVMAVSSRRASAIQWQRDRARAALVVPSVAEIRWHDLRGTFVLASCERPVTPPGSRRRLVTPAATRPCATTHMC